MYNNWLNKKFGFNLIKTYVAGQIPGDGFTVQGAGTKAEKKWPEYRP